MTRGSMQFAARYVRNLSSIPQQMLVAEAFIDLFIHANDGFQLRRFLSLCGISEEQWNKDRVRIFRMQPGVAPE